MNLNQRSEKLLLQVKMQQPTAELEQQLKAATASLLASQLKIDEHKKAFWINCYNAFYQLLRKTRNLDKSRIYKERRIEIAGSVFSLDDIEHGILRRYRWKFSLGYLQDPFASKKIRSLAVDQIDNRIHFALNCGAKSCPPIAFYSSEKIDQQLDQATLSFLESETEVLTGMKQIHVTRLMLWFAADFGGKRGVRRILKEVLGIDCRGYRIKYKPYSREDDLGNFAE